MIIVEGINYKCSGAEARRVFEESDVELYPNVDLSPVFCARQIREGVYTPRCLKPSLDCSFCPVTYYYQDKISKHMCEEMLHHLGVGEPGLLPRTRYISRYQP